MTVVAYLLILASALIVIMIILAVNLNCNNRVHKIYLDDTEYFSPGPSYGFNDYSLMSTPFDFLSYRVPSIIAEYR